MQIVLLINAILGMLPSLIQAAEGLFGAATGKGAEKKEAVLQGVASGLAVAAATGNDDAAKPEVQQAVVTLAGTAVDAIVATYNAVDGWLKPAENLGSDR